MEELLDKDLYLVDLSQVVYIPEIVYKLSSVLDNDETKNRRICLKLGDINLNQAQLLSIKSLINGVGSSLSCLDTKSSDTQKTALSLGIMVSNILSQNVVEIEPSNTYKIADEIKDEPQNIMDEEMEIEEKIDETVNDDVLDRIFSSNTLDNNIFNLEDKKTQDKEEIIVSETEDRENTSEDIEIETYPTKYIKQTLRSGQVINYEGNIVIIGNCHNGCEIAASGDITVWGTLSGIAHAGVNGNTRAKIRALKMNAIQLRIANCYSRRPDSLRSIGAEKTNSFTPEEARIVNGEIVVYKIND